MEWVATVNLIKSSVSVNTYSGMLSGCRRFCDRRSIRNEPMVGGINSVNHSDARDARYEEHPWEMWMSSESDGETDDDSSPSAANAQDIEAATLLQHD